MNLVVIDATGGMLGRIAAYAAKQALLGKTIRIVNCNEILITGRKKSILEEYKAARARGGSALKGPNFPRPPEKIMKRTIRGMLPYKKGRGADALKKIRCYNKVPVEFESAEKVSLKRELKTRAIKLCKLSEEL